MLFGGYEQAALLVNLNLLHLHSMSGVQGSSYLECEDDFSEAEGKQSSGEGYSLEQKEVHYCYCSLVVIVIIITTIAVLLLLLLRLNACSQTIMTMCCI